MNSDSLGLGVGRFPAYYTAQGLRLVDEEKEKMSKSKTKQGKGV